jgi:hypothetical protein
MADTTNNKQLEELAKTIRKSFGEYNCTEWMSVPAPIYKSLMKYFELSQSQYDNKGTKQ